MFGFLKRLVGGDADEVPQKGGAKRFDAPLTIDKPTYAVGDVHGRADLLERLLEKIEADIVARGYEDARLVLMGDFVDRGEDSARVLARLRDLTQPGGADVVALRGNHEEMMLAFLDDPEGAGPRWLRNGGMQTLLSYDVLGISTLSDAETLIGAADRLRAKAEKDIAFMRELPAWRRFGNVLFSHAGGDPELPYDLQAERNLTWGVSRFFQLPRKDGNWCVYGHYVVDEAGVSQGRVAVDTGAYYTGVLSAARLVEGEAPAFLTSA